MLKQTRTQLYIHPVSGVAEQIVAEAAEKSLEDRHRKIAEGQHIQRGKAAVNQHFVHHYLKKQRRDQGEQLQKKRGDQHLGKQRAVFDQRGDKPGDIERLPQAVAQTPAAGEQNKLAAPE